MTDREILTQRLSNLPPYLQQEVLDFMIFLEWKYLKEPPKKSFIQHLREMPDVGLDEDFERIQDTKKPDGVFD